MLVVRGQAKVRVTINVEVVRAEVECEGEQGVPGWGGMELAAVSQVRRALPPDGWQSTVLHDAQSTTVEACEKTCAGR